MLGNRRCITRVQIVDQLHRQVDQRIGVVLARTRYRIRQVRQQREVQVRVLIREEADLQLTHQLPHLLLVQQQRRHRDQRGVLGRDAFGEIQLRQRGRFEERGNRVVDAGPPRPATPAAAAG